MPKLGFIFIVNGPTSFIATPPGLNAPRRRTARARPRWRRIPEGSCLRSTVIAGFGKPDHSGVMHAVDFDLAVSKGSENLPSGLSMARGWRSRRSLYAIEDNG
ncbi:MAG: hypothetical protein QOK03_2066, partial [Candidatus Binataceae bacterium]|nr:hypothetical protein [Candidatus Binataceae bacterium]